MNIFLVLAIFALAAGLAVPAPAWAQAASSTSFGTFVAGPTCCTASPCPPAPDCCCPTPRHYYTFLTRTTVTSTTTFFASHTNTRTVTIAAGSGSRVAKRSSIGFPSYALDQHEPAPPEAFPAVVSHVSLHRRVVGLLCHVCPSGVTIVSTTPASSGATACCPLYTVTKTTRTIRRTKLVAETVTSTTTKLFSVTISRTVNCLTSDVPDFCDGACVDFATDVDNCGGCGRACRFDQQCQAGNCTAFEATPVKLEVIKTSATPQSTFVATYEPSASYNGTASHNVSLQIIATSGNTVVDLEAVAAVDHASFGADGTLLFIEVSDIAGFASWTAPFAIFLGPSFNLTAPPGFPSNQSFYVFAVTTFSCAGSSCTATGYIARDPATLIEDIVMVANVEPTHSRKRDYTDFPIVLPPPVSPGLKLGFLDIPETTYRSVGGSAKGKIKLTLGPNYFGLRGGMVVVMSLWRGPAGRVEIFGGMELSIYANATFGIEGELLGTDEIIPENLQMKLTPRIPFPQLGYTLGKIGSVGVFGDAKLEAAFEWSAELEMNFGFVATYREVRFGAEWTGGSLQPRVFSSRSGLQMKGPNADIKLESGFKFKIEFVPRIYVGLFFDVLKTDLGVGIMQTINIGYEKKNSTDDDCPERVSPFFGTTSKFALDIVKFKEIETTLDEETWICSADEDEHDLPSSFCNFFGFGCRGNANTGVFTGTVSDAVTHAPLSGVSVTVNRTDGSGIVSNVTTSSNGTYRTGQLERNVSYNLFFVYTSDDRYLPSTLFRQQLRDIETSLPVVLEIRPEVPNGTLIGTVKNALDAVGIPGARVEIRRGGSNIVGDPLRTATTSPNGTYIFAGLQAGDYTVSANKTGFIPASVNAYVALANQTAPNLFLSPQGTNASQPNATGTLNGTMRVVLSWGALPLDLDVHIRGPVANSTERFHIYYRTLGPDDLIEPPYAHLDHDDRFGNGLETATIARFVPGIYNIYIHNYLGDAPIVGSEARVDLYDGSSHVRTFYPPAAPDARYWLLFTMDGATKAIDADNVLTEVEPTS